VVESEWESFQLIMSSVLALLTFDQANIHDIAARRPGKIQLIITTAEQLFKTPEGHTPRLANLLRENQFQQRIKRIHIDEAHSIHITGLSRHGIAAFRPAWGKLDELKVLLPTRIPWQAMTATLPTHMQKTVEQKILRPGYITIRSTSNRPNTIYATHCVPTDLGDPRNYSCFLCNPFAFKKQPRVLIFFDNKTIAASVALYLDSQLPLDFQCKGVVRHYHSEMSEEYLQKVHSSFIDADGCCKILCATSAESVVGLVCL
jgi:superfamily II DNA helicase RecQ